MRIEIVCRKTVVHSVEVEVPDAEAATLMLDPESHASKLNQLCPRLLANWADADETTYEVNRIQSKNEVPA